MASTYKGLGFDILDRFEEMESEVTSRLNIVTNIITNNNEYLTNEMAKHSAAIKQLETQLNFYKWYVNIPWYKKIWWSIRKRNLTNIYKLNKI